MVPIRKENGTIVRGKRLLQLCVVAVEELLGGYEAGLATGKDGLLGLGQLLLDERVVVEVEAQVLVDALVHPVLGLLVAAIVEVAVGLDEVDVLVDHVPDLLDAQTVEAAVAEHLRHPAAVGLGEEMEGVAEVGGCHVTAVYVVAVALVDDDAVGDLHDAALDALQLVAGAGHLDEQEEVDHGVAGRLALAHADGLYEDLVVASRLAEDDGLARLTGHAAERTGRGAGADERVGVQGELLHARLVAEDAALGALTGGVDGEHGQAAPLLAEHVDAELVDAGRFAGTGHAADAHTDAASAVGQALIDDLLGTGLVVGVDTLDEGDGLREDGDVALEDALDHLPDREVVTAEAAALQVGIDDRRLLNAAVHLQAGIF